MRALRATNSESMFRMTLVRFLGSVREKNSTFWVAELPALLRSKYHLDVKEVTEGDVVLSTVTSRLHAMLGVQLAGKCIRLDVQPRVCSVLRDVCVC